MKEGATKEEKKKLPALNTIKINTERRIKMKNKFLLIACCILSVTVFAQNDKSLKKALKYASTITANDLKKHLTIVAGAEMEGRETATPGQRKAAEYLEGQFRAMGLEPGNNGSYQQYFNVSQDSLVDAKLEVNGQTLQFEKDFTVGAGSIDATMKFSEVLLVGPGLIDSLKNMNLAGRLVIVVSNLATAGRNSPGVALFQTLVSKGVAGILLPMNPNIRTAPSRKGAQNVSGGFTRSITPQLVNISEKVARAIIGNEYDQVVANLSSVKTYRANILLDVKKVTVTTPSSNVIAIVPGTDRKDQYLFITAHYDHLGKRGDSIIYYGADDDGSGTVGVLEMAEAFIKAKVAGNGPRRTVVFMAVSGEEKGLWGSDYYSSHPIFPLENTTADLNIDMIGRTDSSRKVGDSLNYVYVVGDDKLSSDLRPISEGVNKKYVKMELDYKFNDPNDRNRIYFRSDHYNFAKKGVPIIFYYDGMLGADYHKPTDTVDKINFGLLEKRAKLVFLTAWEMANRDNMLKRDIPLSSVPVR